MREIGPFSETFDFFLLLGVFIGSNDIDIECEPRGTRNINYNIFLNKCLGAGRRQYCRYNKSPWVTTLLKEIWESSRGKENLTKWGLKPRPPN